MIAPPVAFFFNGRKGASRRNAKGPVSQFQHPAHHAPGEGFTADRAEFFAIRRGMVSRDCRIPGRVPRPDADPAFPVTVVVVFPLLREKFDSRQNAAAHRLTQRGIGKFHIKNSRLTAQLVGGVRV